MAESTYRSTVLSDIHSAGPSGSSAFDPIHFYVVYHSPMLLLLGARAAGLPPGIAAAHLGELHRT